MTEIIPALLSAFALVLVALINRRTARIEKTNQKTAACRERESRLSMDMMAASIELADVTAYALAGGRLNGNVERARQKAAQAREAYDAFLRDVSAEEVTK